MVNIDWAVCSTVCHSVHFFYIQKWFSTFWSECKMRWIIWKKTFLKLFPTNPCCFEYFSDSDSVILRPSYCELIRKIKWYLPDENEKNSYRCRSGPWPTILLITIYNSDGIASPNITQWINEGNKCIPLEKMTHSVISSLQACHRAYQRAT